jgi:hypothetical protein
MCGIIGSVSTAPTAALIVLLNLRSQNLIAQSRADSRLVGSVEHYVVRARDRTKHITTFSSG